MLDRRLGFLVLLAAVAAMVALGVLGVGHGGWAQTNLDMRFLYLAGERWWHGISAYVPGALDSSDPWLGDAAAGYDFAYPPQSAPLCLLLAWSPAGARVLMTVLNVAAALALAALSVRLAREGEPDQRGARTDAATWAIPAIVLGNPATAFVIWAGQTTLIVTLALMLGWYYARRDRWVIGGLLLAISTIKPQVSLLVVLWLLLERRWRVLVAIALGIVALSAVPLVISGPLTLVTDWSGAAWRYSSGPYNLLGSRMVFGLRNVLYVAGIDVPLLLPAALLIVGWLWYSLRSVAEEDLLAILVGLALLFGFSHSYDIAALIPLVPAFWRHVHDRPASSRVALGLMLVITIPNSLFEPLRLALLFQVRVVALLVALLWLVVMSVRRTSGLRRTLAEERLWVDGHR